MLSARIRSSSRAAFLLPLRRENIAMTWLHSRAEMHFFSARRAGDCRLTYWKVFPSNAASACPWCPVAAASICPIRLRWSFMKPGARWASGKPNKTWVKKGFYQPFSGSIIFGLRLAVKQRFHRFSCRHPIMKYAAYRSRDRHLDFQLLAQPQYFPRCMNSLGGMS